MNHIRRESGSVSDQSTIASDGGCSALPRFCADDCLLAELQTVLHAEFPTRVKVSGAGAVWIDPLARTYQHDIVDEEHYFLTRSQDCRVDRIEGLPQASQSRPVDELLWSAAYSASRGALLDRCHPFDVIRLIRWPNFTRIPHTEHMLPLCSLLSRRPTSIAFAYRMLRIPRAEAITFCSAAMVSGYLEVISSQPGSTESGSDSDVDMEVNVDSFWSRLFRRVSGL